MTVNHPIKSGLQRHVEDVFGGPLEELLPRWYNEERLSPARIASRLRGRGIDVTDQCIRNWTRQFGGRRGWIFETAAEGEQNASL